MKTIVYLTSKRFDKRANRFKKCLAAALRDRGVNTICGYSYDWLNWFRQYQSYEIAIAFDFYRDDIPGSGLVLHKDCFHSAKYFAYSLSDSYDCLNSLLKWRDFEYVASDNKKWRSFFNGVSAPTKIIFYLCNAALANDLENYYLIFDYAVETFVDEIICYLHWNSEETRK